MPSITLQFSAPLNTSCQVGDTVYYVQTSMIGGFDTNYTSAAATTTNDIVEIGQIREIQNPTTNSPVIIAYTTIGGGISGNNRFILFSKDNKANLSSPSGYYAAVKMVNDDTANAGELFSVATNAFGSSGQTPP